MNKEKDCNCGMIEWCLVCWRKAKEGKLEIDEDQHNKAIDDIHNCLSGFI